MAELQGVTKELDDLKLIQKSYIEHIGKIEPQLANLKIRSGELENQLREQKAQFDQLNKQYVSLNNDHNARGAELAALQNVKKRNTELDLLISSQASEIDRLNTALNQLRSGDESAMPEVLRRRFEELKSEAAKLAPLNEQLTKLQSEYGGFQKEHENVKKRISVLTARCEAAESSNERSKHELEQLKKLNAELAEMNRKSTEDLKQKAESQISEMKTHTGELESQLREQKASVSRLAEMKIRTGELESQLREQKAAWEEINKKYQALNSEHNAQSGKLIALQDVNKRNSELEKRLAVQTSEIDRLNLTVRQLQSGEEKFMPTEFRRKLKELRSAAAKLASINDQLARLENTHEAMKQQFLDRIAKLNIRCEAAEAFSERRKQELEQLRKLNAELVEMNRNSTSALQNKVDQAQLDRLNAEIAAMNKLYSEVTAERDRLNSELDAMRRGITPESSPVKIAESPEELASSGLIAERNGNIQLAIWNYKQALLADENFRSAHLRLGLILYERRDYAGALPHLSAARGGEKFNLDLSIKTARCQIELKRFGNAKNIVDILLKNHSGDYRVQMLAGLIESGSGSASAAEDRLITASRLAPGKPEVYIELARLLGNAVIDLNTCSDKRRILGKLEAVDIGIIITAEAGHGVHCAKVNTVKQNGAAGGLFQKVHAPHQGRFAGAAHADDAVNLAGQNVKADILQGVYLAGFGVKSFGKVLDTDDGLYFHNFKAHHSFL
jgi:chromosome segregation ATPase